MRPPELSLVKYQRLSSVPTSIVGVAWKWDGTSIPALVRLQRVADELGAVVKGDPILAGKSAECLTQRGCLVSVRPNQPAQRIAYPIPPKARRHADKRNIVRGRKPTV